MMAADSVFIPHLPATTVGIITVPDDLPITWTIGRASVIRHNLIDPRNSREVRAAHAGISQTMGNSARDFMASQWTFAMVDAL